MVIRTSRPAGPGPESDTSPHLVRPGDPHAYSRVRRGIRWAHGPPRHRQAPGVVSPSHSGRFSLPKRLTSSPDDDRLSFERGRATFGPRISWMPARPAPGAQVAFQSNGAIAEAVDAGAVVHLEAPHHTSRRDRSVGPRNSQPRNRRVPLLAATRKVPRDVGRDAYRAAVAVHIGNDIYAASPR